MKSVLFGAFLVHVFPDLDRIRSNTLYLSVFSPNAGKTLNTDIFHVVTSIHFRPMFIFFTSVFFSGDKDRKHSPEMGFQLAITCSKLTIETLEQGVEFFKS